MARTTHDLAFDAVRDEIVAPNPFAEAILFYRGGASGEEKPIRVIQGPNTLLHIPDNAAVDPIHGEVFVVDHTANAVLVFPREGNGNIAPSRILQGPRTTLNQPSRVGVDPINNLLAVTATNGVVIFNRTDQGDVAPRAVIAGPQTGITKDDQPARITLYPEGKKIFVAVLGKRTRATMEMERGFIGIWQYGDNGDVAPWAIIKGSATTKIRNPFGGIALNPEAKEVMVVENGKPAALLIFHLPELFQR